MTLLYTQGFEGFPSTSEDRSDLDTEFNFSDSVDLNAVGIRAGRVDGLAAWVDEGSSLDGSFRLPVSGYSQEDVWIVGMAFYRDHGLLSVESGAAILKFVNPAGTALMTLRLQAGNISAKTGGPTGTVIAHGNVNILSRVWYYLECKVTFHDTAGTVHVRINEEEVVAETGVNTSNSLTTYAYPAMIHFGQSGGNAGVWIDDIYIADDTGSNINDFLGDVRLLGLAPTADGTTNNFTAYPGAGDNQDEVVDTDFDDPDASYVESNTAGHVDTYAYGNITGTPAAVPAVSVKSYVKKSDAGSRTFSHASRSGGSEVYSAAIYPNAGTYRHLQSHFEQDDNGGSPQAWTATAVNAAEFGVKVES